MKYNIVPVGLITKIEISLVITCNNAERSEKSKFVSIVFREMKVYSKLKCGDKLIPVGENLLSS